MITFANNEGKGNHRVFVSSSGDKGLGHQNGFIDSFALSHFSRQKGRTDS